MTEENTPAPEAGSIPQSIQTEQDAEAEAQAQADDLAAAFLASDATEAATDEPAKAAGNDAAPVPKSTKKPAQPAPSGGERIAKVIARVGLASRRVAEKMILDGRVKVNGKVIDSPALDIGPGDKVVVDGKPLDAPQDTRLWLYYKPTGLVTTESDELGRRTIYDELPEDLPRVMTVGRLDLTSEGLLLLTNDGELKRRLELPATGWLRRYKVRVNGRPTNLTFDPLRRGIVIDGEEFQPMEVSLDSQRGDNAWLTIGIREGRNREIRRAMEHVGLIVNRLIRLSYGPFRLTTMKEGEVAEVRRRLLRDQLGPLLPGNEDAEDARPVRGRRPGADSRPGGRPARGAEGERPARKGFGARGEGVGDRPRKPFGKRPEGEAEAPRRPYAPRDGEAPRKGFGTRKPFEQREDGDAPRKPYARRADEGGDARKPYGRTPDGDGPRRPYAPRDGEAARKPYGARDGESGRKSYGARDGDDARKPHAARDGEARRKPYAPRDGEGGRKPYTPRDGEGARTPYGRPGGDGPRKPHAARDGEAPRKYASRSEADGDAPRKPRHKAGAPRGEGFAARPPRDDAAPRKPHAARAEGEEFKARPRGDGEGIKPRAPRSDGEGYKSRGPRAEGEGFKPRAPRAEAGGFKRREGEGFKPRSEGFKSHGPRSQGEGFKRGEGKPGGLRPKSGGPGKPGGFKPRGDRPAGGKPGPRKGPSRQG